jgi:hypothetical protein
MRTTIAKTIIGAGPALSVQNFLSDALRDWRQRVGYYSMCAALPAMLTAHAQDTGTDRVTSPKMLLAEQDAELTARRDGRRRTTAAFLRQQTEYRLPHQRGSFDIVSVFNGNDDCPGTPIPAGAYTAASPYVDTGDTTGANDTVTNIQPYYTYGAHGPDRIYTFVITSIGANPEIKVTTTTPRYKPMIYVTDKPCPAGTGATISDWGSRWYSTKYSNGDQDNPAIIGEWAWGYWESLYFGRRLYLFIDSAEARSSGSYTLTIKDIHISTTPKVERHVRPDFDGDGLADFAVFRPGNATWYVRGSTQGFSSIQWGQPTDKLVPEDYDGDGKTDPAVYRDGIWQILGSAQGPITRQWGLPTDIPVPADYTGDGLSEIAIFRDGAWWIYDLATDRSYVANWGLTGDRPVPMDYDGDGKVDQAVYRDGVWYLNRSRIGTAAIRWGLGLDRIVPGYYGPHNEADFSVYRNGSWFTLIPPYYFDVPNGVLSMQLGLSTDTPVAGNFFDTYAADAGVFRDGVWWMRTCARYDCGSYGIQWGQAGDIPISGVYNR